MKKTVAGIIIGTWRSVEGDNRYARFKPKDGTKEIDIPIDLNEFYAIQFDKPATLTLEYNL